MAEKNNCAEKEAESYGQGTVAMAQILGGRDLNLSRDGEGEGESTSVSIDTQFHTEYQYTSVCIDT